MIGRPPFCNAANTWGTVAAELADLSSAQAPATCGAAIEVPLAVPKPPAEYASGMEDVTASPGASRLRKLALLEKLDIAFCLVVEPTLMAFDRQAGELSPLALPLFPAATTVAVLASRKLSMIVLYAGKLASQVPA